MKFHLRSLNNLGAELNELKQRVGQTLINCCNNNNSLIVNTSQTITNQVQNISNAQQNLVQDVVQNITSKYKI